MTWAFFTLLQTMEQSMAAAAAKGLAAPTREPFTAPGSNVAKLAAAESWHAFWWVIPFIALAYILLVYVMIKFRDKGDGRQPAHFHENNPLEFAWTVIPLVVVLMVALHSFPVLHYMEYGGNHPALNVNVVGHQFFWEYKYPDYGIDISNGTLVVPADEVVDLDLTSVDVIHGFYVPGLGIQVDALPGRLSNLWFKADPGYYKGQCTQLCGVNHAEMLIEVQVLPRDQFEQWLQAHRSQPAPATTAAAKPAAAPAGGAQ
ncbi:MAG: cytochrome c oxidase subunit II [Terriglobales bacterium]